MAHIHLISVNFRISINFSLNASEVGLYGNWVTENRNTSTMRCVQDIPVDVAYRFIYVECD